MALILWSGWIFSELFCLWVWRLFLLLFIITSFFRRVSLKGEGSHLLETVQINWLPCHFPTVTGWFSHPLQCLLQFVSPHPQSVHHSCRDLSLMAAHSGSQQNCSRQCSKVLENSAALAAGWCWELWAPQCKCPQTQGLSSWLKLLWAQGCPSGFQSWILESQDLSAQQVIQLDSVVVAGFFVVSTVGWFTQHWNIEHKSKFLLFW